MWTALRFSGDLFVPHSNSFSMNLEKRHSFLIFTMLRTRTHSKILEKSFQFKNGHLTSFDSPNCQTTCWQWKLGIKLKIFSRVQRRKYDTIVNIIEYLSMPNSSWKDCWHYYTLLIRHGYNESFFFSYSIIIYWTVKVITCCFNTVSEDDDVVMGPLVSRWFLSVRYLVSHAMAHVD